MDSVTIPLGGALGIGSGWALVVLAVVMFFRGFILTRREHMEAMKAKDSLIEFKDLISAEKDKRIEKQEALIANLTQQNALMLDSALPMTNSILKALHESLGEQT